MNVVKQEKFNKRITKDFSYSFKVEESGLYIVEISARVRSEKQIGRKETDDDDLRIEIDGRAFPLLSNNQRYFDSPAVASGGRGGLKIYLGMALGAVGLVGVLLGGFVFQEWNGAKLWNEAIFSQEKIEEVGENLDSQHPQLLSNDSLYGKETHFAFSPGREYVSFVRNVFEEYGNDWDRYWALILWDVEDRTERELFVDSVKMSSYQWVDPYTIRIFHSAGTGARAYKDIDATGEGIMFAKNFAGSASFWTQDEDYMREAMEGTESRNLYYGMRDRMTNK